MALISSCSLGLSTIIPGKEQVAWQLEASAGLGREAWGLGFPFFPSSTGRRRTHQLHATPPTMSMWETRWTELRSLHVTWGQEQLPLIENLLYARHLTHMLLHWIPQLEDVSKTPILLIEKIRAGKVKPLHPHHVPVI